MAKKYINTIPEDAFSFIEKKLEGKENVINLSIGNPIDPPDTTLLDKLAYYSSNRSIHGYGFTNKGTEREVNQSVAKYYKRRFNTDICQDTETVLLNGSKEGIYGLLATMVAEGEKVLIPSPSYSVYSACVHIIGGKSIYFDCDRENFTPDLSSISEKDLIESSVMILCSPGNPTTNILSKTFLENAISIARKYNIKIIHDIAYGEICYDGHDVTSILSLPYGKDVAVELYSLSKSCNIAGWRIGFALGNKEILKNLKTFKFNIDFGTFLPFQKVVIDIMNDMEFYSQKQAKRYEERMDYFVEGMNKIGWNVKKPNGSFFLWVKIPQKYSHMNDKEFVSYVLDETNVLISPGSGFGEGGKGYVRIALVEHIEVLEKAILNLEKLKLKQEDLVLA